MRKIIIILATFVIAAAIGVLIGAYVNDPAETVRIAGAFVLALVMATIGASAFLKRA